MYWSCRGRHELKIHRKQSAAWLPTFQQRFSAAVVRPGSAMVPISACATANTCRSGRAMVPSSHDPQQRRSASSRPCPPGHNLPGGQRASPPSTVCKREYMAAEPGRWSCIGGHRRLHGTERSAAEMPVVTPFGRSIDTVKAVEYWAPLRATIGGSCSRSQRRASASDRSGHGQAGHELMASGVTWSAQQAPGRLVPRCSSSIRITMRPARMSATMSQQGNQRGFKGQFV
jgi:hypothetical protein